MLKNKVVFFPQYFSEVTTDYQQQTIKILKKKNDVVVINFNSKIRKNIFKKKHGVYYYYPLPIFSKKKIFIYLVFYFNFLYLLIYCIKNIHNFFFKEKIMWTTHPNTSFFLQLFHSFFKISIFDMVDFLEGKENQESITKLIKQVDLLFVNSETLYKIYKPQKENIHIVKQGFRIEDFYNHKKKREKKYIGYIGGLNFRIDYDLLIKLASNNNWEFVLCGPIIDYYPHQEKKINKLLSLPNVKHVPMVKKKDIPSIISEFKIGIIPYDTSDKFNKNCYPMKLFEYFYLGKPVISTPIQELILPKFQDVIKIGKNYEEWKIHIEEEIKSKWTNEKKKKQQQMAIENSWKNKIQQISSFVEDFETLKK